MTRQAIDLMTLNEESIERISENAEKGYQGAMRIKQLSDRYRKFLAADLNEEPKEIYLKELFDELYSFFYQRLKEFDIEFAIQAKDDLMITT